MATTAIVTDGTSAKASAMSAWRRLAAADAGHPADHLEQVAAVRGRHGASELHDRARRHLGQRSREPAERARPGHAENVAGPDQVHQRLARLLAKATPQRRLVIIGKVEDERVLETGSRTQLCRQARVQGASGKPDLYAHHPGLPGGVE